MKTTMNQWLELMKYNKKAKIFLNPKQLKLIVQKKIQFKKEKYNIYLLQKKLTMISRKLKQKRKMKIRLFTNLINILRMQLILIKLMKISSVCGQTNMLLKSYHIVWETNNKLKSLKIGLLIGKMLLFISKKLKETGKKILTLVLV